MMMKDMMMITKHSVKVGACTECDANISFSKSPFLGQQKTCPECRSDLEVIGLSPIELDWAYDYDDDDYDDADYTDDF